jgi:hypothetical protein
VTKKLATNDEPRRPAGLSASTSSPGHKGFVTVGSGGFGAVLAWQLVAYFGTHDWAEE